MSSTIGVRSSPARIHTSAACQPLGFTAAAESIKTGGYPRGAISLQHETTAPTPAALRERLLSSSCARPERLRDTLEDALYSEQLRLHAPGADRLPAYERDDAFWDGLRARLEDSHDRDLPQRLGEIVDHYGAEIAGNFDPRMYQVVTRAVPPALGLLLNAISPRRLMTQLPGIPDLGETLQIGGETAQLKTLVERGTVLLAPSHASHLDSIVLGYALFQLGLPHFTYGASLNLFSNPLISFFMGKLGAYTVDRTKLDPLYRETLRAYASLTLEANHHSIFFPAGARSRSGAVEAGFTRPLLGAGLSAYTRRIQAGHTAPEIYIVPATISYGLVLEAEALIEDFLQDKARRRAIIDDDDFSRPKRVFEFLTKLIRLDGKIEVRFGRALDPFGQPVDDEGRSVLASGRVIDPARYLYVGGEVRASEQRDAEYTHALSQGLVRAYSRGVVVHCTHLLARAVFGCLLRRHPEQSVLRIVRAAGAGELIPLPEVYRAIDTLREQLRPLAAAGALHLSQTLKPDAAGIVADALAQFASFHPRPAVARRGDSLLADDRRLLLYYQDRLEGFSLPGRALLSPDRESIAEEGR